MATEEVENYSVRPMKPEEVKKVDEIFGIVDIEGWKLILDKFHMLCETYPQKFYVAVTSDGELVGAMTLFPTFEGEYVLGHVVRGSCRQKGLARKMASDILVDNPGAIVSLAAIPGVDRVYVNMGFHFTQPQEGHNVFRVTLDCDQLESNLKELDKDIFIAPYDDKSFDDLVSYDREARGYQNTSYVAMQVKILTVMTAKNSQGKMLGFAAAFLRNDDITCDGLYADSEPIAVRLVIGIMKAFPGKNRVKFQVPSSKLFLSTLGSIESSYKMNRFSTGPREPTSALLSKVYDVGDLDYRY